MRKTSVSLALFGALLAFGPQVAQAAAPDWSKVPKRDVQVFHAGVTPIEWIMKKSDHSGRTGLNKGESCVGCHEEKGGLNFDMKRLAGKDLEPKGAPKTMNFPVSVQSAYDKDNAYIRLTFKAPSGGADTSDKDNDVKVAVMFANDKVKPLWHHEVIEALGDKSLQGVRVRDVRSGATQDVACRGLFYAIGHVPNTAFLNGQLPVDETGYLITKPGTTQTSIAGVFACGDVQDKRWRQAITAAGTGCMAALEAEAFLAGH